MLDNMQRIMLSTNDKMNSKEMDTQHIDTMDECDVISSPRKNKTVTVPRVQSMQDYIQAPQAFDPWRNQPADRRGHTQGDYRGMRRRGNSPCRGLPFL